MRVFAEINLQKGPKLCRMMDRHVIPINDIMINSGILIQIFCINFTKRNSEAKLSQNQKLVVLS